MKATIAIVITLFVSFSAIGANKNIIASNGTEMTATFVGLNDNGEFKFKDGDKEMVFQEIGEEVDIDLSEDTNINKKFVITWEEVKVDVYDDEGEPTGQKVKVNRILKLKAAK